MAINRIAYFAQSGSIKNTTGAGGTTYVLPVNSANIEVTRPIEAVTAFGQFNSFAQAQTNVTTCKASLKGYLGSGTSGIGLSSFDSTFLNDLVNTTQTGNLVVSVSPQGFTMTGLCTNIGIDISVGGFAMFDLGFAGVGQPSVADAQTAATSPQAWTTGALAPVTTMSIGSSGLLQGANATSIKFSYDLPTDTLTSLGENPNALQGSLNSFIATKAPYKASLSVEGFGVNTALTDAQIASGVQVGTIIIKLPNGKLTSKSFNNAAGQATATFSYSAEDVSATFTTGTLGAYVQNNTALASPTWGA